MVVQQAQDGWKGNIGAMEELKSGWDGDVKGGGERGKVGSGYSL